MTPGEMEKLLKTLEDAERKASAWLRSRGWTDADIERGMELLQIAEQVGVDVGGPCWN